MAAYEEKTACVVGGSFSGFTTALILHRLGFNVQVYERCKTLRDGGAGIGLDDLSIVCLEALGFGPALFSTASLPMRLQIHNTNEKEIFRSAYPFVACYWNDIYTMLYHALPKHIVHFDRNMISFEHNEDQTVTVSFQNGVKEKFDLLVGCDGPTSTIRGIIHPKNTDLIYRGYTAWRGWVDKDSYPNREELYAFYPELANGAIYFHVNSTESGHMVFYELPENEETGRKINWLWYVPKKKDAVQAIGSGRDKDSKHQSKRITADASDRALETLYRESRRYWPKCVADFIRAIPDPFMNDIYDLEPLPTAHWGQKRITLVGDAAHAVTPHFLKSSNMAIVDAVELGIQLSISDDLTKALRAYESFRHPITSKTLLISRRLGKFRQGMESSGLRQIQVKDEWNAISHAEFLSLAGDGRPDIAQEVAKSILTRRFIAVTLLVVTLSVIFIFA